MHCGYICCIGHRGKIEENAAGLLLKLNSSGFLLSDGQVQEVRSAGLGAELKTLSDAFINSDAVEEFADFGECHTWLFDIPIATKGENAGKPLEGICYWDKIPEEWKEKWKDIDIDRSHWAVERPEELNIGFQKFIMSHIPRFDQIMAYEPFYVYCEQARRWLEDKRTLSDIPEAERYEWKQRELSRIKQNKLYGLNKYVSIKEDNQISGRRKYKASTPQALLAYLVDRGNSFDLVKGRQAAVTSTMLAMAALEAVVRSSFTGVFMVHKKDGTGKTLFKDKFQSTFQHLDRWLIAGVDVSKGFSSESAIIDYDPGESKIQKGMDTAEMRLLSAEDSMNVNGRTPTWSLFDEAQNIPTYQTIKAEIDPTMYQFNIESGRMELVRQAFGWGTGSSNNTGQGAFENDFKGLLASFEGGEDTEAWVPLFMDWTCRPGMTRGFYNRMRRKYLRGQTEETKGLSATERLALFSAHYPSKPDDAFMTSHKTMVPMTMIVNQQNRIMNDCHKQGLAPTPGHFEPIFNESVQLQETSYFPHPVIGARWVPAPADSLDSPVKLFLHPDNRYADRYWQGTDPIQNDGGFSRFSSQIFDAGTGPDENGEVAQAETVACVMNARTEFPQALFVQSILMGIYYRNYGQRACKELIEINIGHRYADFKCSEVFGLRDSLMTRFELLPQYRGGTHIYGMDLKGGKNSRKERLYGHTTEMFQAFGHNIWYYDIWSQVRNISVESKPDGSVVWGTTNKNVYNDDMVYAFAYATLAWKSFNRQPRLVTSDNKQYKMVRTIKRRKDTMMPYYEMEKREISYA